MLFTMKNKAPRRKGAVTISIENAENALAQLARILSRESGSNLEVFGYLIGLEADRITHLAMPESIIGVREDRREEMKYITDTNSHTQVMPAVGEAAGGFGILVHVHPKRVNHRFMQGHWTFIPDELLVTNRTLGRYIGARLRGRHFPGRRAEEITRTDIVEVVRQSTSCQHISLMDQKDQWIRLTFLPDLKLNVDAFVSDRRVYPLNHFTMNALSVNRFKRMRNGRRVGCYGRLHVHYAYRLSEIMTDPLINALHRQDQRFFELMTPVDAISMLDSAQATREISDGQMNMGQIVEGVLALDPKSYTIVGATYIDLELLNTNRQVNTFERLANEALGSREIAPNLRWFEYIRTMCTSDVPHTTIP